MTREAATTSCSTCGLARPLGEFYASSTECKPCKRQRSQGNRAAAAEKVALADRLLIVLERLAAQGWHPDALLASRLGEIDTGPRARIQPSPEGLEP